MTDPDSITETISCSRRVKDELESRVAESEYEKVDDVIRDALGLPSRKPDRERPVELSDLDD